MKKLLIILAALIVLLFLGLVYEGLFQKAEIKEASEGGYVLMGIDHKGAYSDIGKVFQSLSEEVKKTGIQEPAFAGVYFDDPGKVKEEDLRSYAAVIVRSADDSLKLCSIPGIHSMNIDKGNAMVCDMKTGDMISVIIATMKAYPAFEAYFKAHPEFTPQIKYVYELYGKGNTRYVFQY